MFLHPPRKKAAAGPECSGYFLYPLWTFSSSVPLSCLWVSAQPYLTCASLNPCCSFDDLGGT